MTVPDKEVVVTFLNKLYNSKFNSIKRKKILYEGFVGGTKIIVCTPSSKLHDKGCGWFDLNIAQVDILDKSDISILAIRMEGNKVYYVNFKELRGLLSASHTVYTPILGPHWKFFVWPTSLEIQGCKERFLIQPVLQV